METKWGLTPDMGASTMLSSLLPIDQSLLLTHHAQPISAEQARDINLVTQLSDDLDGAIELLLSKLLQQSPDALAANNDFIKQPTIFLIAAP